jgi:Transposase DDE domain group 1
VATQCHTRFDFRFQPRLVLDFDGGQLTGETRLILLREFDERVGLDELLIDQRDRRYIAHSALTLLRQRVYQIAAGYEDANDASFPRHDPILHAVAAGRDQPLASQPTLSRLEHAVPWESIRRFARLGLQWFCGLARHKMCPSHVLNLQT